MSLKIKGCSGKLGSEAGMSLKIQKLTLQRGNLIENTGS
jgi:hypothetical protein